MYSTTTLVKNSRFSGKIIGTHQQLDHEARRFLTNILPHGVFFPSSKEIIHFEGSRGPDGLKRKSPNNDEPSHMMILASEQIHEIIKVSRNRNATRSPSEAVSATTPPNLAPTAPGSSDHTNSSPETSQATNLAISADSRSLPEMIVDHHWNLVQALRQKDATRAAFEAAWMAHMIVDGLTPAHHFPLTDVKEKLMTSQEMVKIFGQPVKGMMRGHNALETMRNNWLYWGAKGFMSQHIGYEYGVAMIAATLPHRALAARIDPSTFVEQDFFQNYPQSVAKVQQYNMYDRFCKEGWTTELAVETKNILLPEITKNIALGWYSTITEAYGASVTSKIHQVQPTQKYSKRRRTTRQKRSHYRGRRGQE